MIMLIALIAASALLLLSLIAIVIIGVNVGLDKEEWIATFMFIFCLPIYLFIKLAYIIKANRERAKIRKRRKELGLDKEESEECK